MVRICVVDGQSGKIGSTLIKSLKAEVDDHFDLIALGTNAIATAQMLRAGAKRGGSGENAICRTVVDVDCIIVSIAITWANAMLVIGYCRIYTNHHNKAVAGNYSDCGATLLEAI